jgi:hypothetical protein
MSSINYILWAFVIGIGVAFGYSFYTSRILGKLVRKLLSIDACSPETAVSPEQIGLKIGSMLRFSLRNGTSFSETVLKNENGNFYISPAQVNKAKIKYKSENMTVFLLLVILILLAGIALISTYVYPDLMDRIKHLTGNN